ncbi:MAG: alpha/beta hydrolase fold domain-containing protein [Clostridia bacterium]|nr:alpha/beta hydrolase fold domain-containing protein [Clostridia bacterium]
MKKPFRRILAVAVCLALTLAFLPKFSLDTSAASRGNASYSSGNIINAYATTAVQLDMSKAASVSGDTITYVADRAYHSKLSDLGDVYSVTFMVIGIYCSTDISSTGCDVSDHYHLDNYQISSNTSKNSGIITVSTSGKLIGDLPEVGEVMECTLTAKINALSMYNGNRIIDGVSKTVNIRILCVDSTDLSSLVMSVSRYSSECWTPETWAPFASAYSTANAVAKDANSTQTQIESALYDLETAKANLVHNGPITQCEYCLGGSMGSSGGVIEIKDVSYGSDPRNVMDIYLPENKTGECGLIMNIHAGGWLIGSKENTTGACYADCVNFGVVTAAISYRYASSSVTGAMILDDIQAATKKAKEVAEQYGLNLTKMMTTGGSAGGHLSLLYAYSRGSVSSVKPVCVATYSGPTDLTNSKYWDSNFGKSNIADVFSWLSDARITGSVTQYLNRSALLKVSPVNYVSTAVPTLICHGAKDRTVDYSEATALDEKLTSAGIYHEFITYPNSDHGLESDPDKSTYSNERYAYFVNTYLCDTMPTEVHRYVSNTVAKTCTSDGYTMNCCKDCGQYFLSNIVPASHEPGDWEVATPATVEAPGLEVVKCTVCGNVLQSREIEQLPPEEETVTVTPKEDTDIVVDDENKLIINVDQGVEDLESLIDYEGATVQYTPNRNGFGTGTKVDFISEKTGEIISTYTVVISGDVTGDGYVDTFDLAVAGEYINTFTTPEEIAYMKAADMFEDEYLDASDMAFMIFVSNFEG